MITDAINISIEQLIKPFEGYARRLPDGSCAAYPDPASGADPWTIGYGSTGKDINDGTIWTHRQALEALNSEVIAVTSGLLKISPSLISASDRRIAALISFCYNLGLGNYRISTLRERVNDGDWQEAACEILRWNKAYGRIMPGLTRRRVAEAMFLE